jgi:hypothetical protein
MDKDVLDALCSLALAKVTHPLNEELAADHLAAANESAFNVGLKGLPLPESFRGTQQHPLSDEYNSGKVQLQSHTDYLENHLDECWSSSWNTSNDGRYQTKAVVGKTEAGFVAGLYTSELGADPGDALLQPEVKTLAEAIKMAHQQEAAWHADDLYEEAVAGSVPTN